MAEGFEVEAHYVSGFGDLMSAEQGNISAIREHVEYFARANPEYYEGLLSLLTVPVNEYASSVTDRLGDRWGDTKRTANELRRVAWTYLGQEEENTRTLFGEVSYAPDGDAESYPSSSPELPRLEVAEMDFSEEFQDLGVLMFYLVWFFHTFLGWAPHNDLIEKLAGNWNALDMAGDALINAGNGAELVAGSMTDGLATLDAHWNGGAAQACAEYVTRLSGAVGEEGPLNRTVGRLYKLIAEEAQEAIRQIIRDLTVPTEDIGTKLGYSRACILWVPIGESSMEDAVATLENCKDLYNAAKGMVETIESVVEQAKTFVESLVNMSEASNVDQVVDEMANALGPWGQQVQEGLATTADIADLADTSEFADAPSGGYAAGDDLERAGD